MSARKKASLLDRRKVVAQILASRGDALVVTGLGAPTWDAAAAGDCALNFYTWGGMGCAAMVGLGLALAQPKRRVIVITGDGEMLMALGALATIAAQQPRNLSIVVMDNEHYGETGMQETATRHGADLVAIAKGAGFKRTMLVTQNSEIPALRTAINSDGCLFALAKIEAASLPLVLPPRDGAILQARMREAILGPTAHHQM